MRSRLFCTSALLLLALAGPAAARGTLDSILPDIRAQHPGRLSDAEPWTDPDGRTHYKIKWLTPEGRILYFNADADSGRYSSSGGDGSVGRQWRGHGGERVRGEDDDAASSGDENGGRHRERGNSDGNGDSGGQRSHWNDDGGDWHDRHGGDRGGHDSRGGDNGGHHHHDGN